MEKTLAHKLYKTLKGDKAIWLILLVLSIWSILIVYSSTGTLAYQHAGRSQEFYLFNQAVFVVVGLGLAYLCYLMHYMRYSQIAPFLLLIAIPLLLYTLFFGAEINEARRWMYIPFTDRTFQTSDFAKLALIIYVARSISSKQEVIRDFKSAFIPIILPIIVICGLIAPADLSTSVLLFATCVMMMIVGRVKTKYVAFLVGCGLLVFSSLVALGNYFPDFVRSETWSSRMEHFIHDEDGGYQIEQSKIAIANGAWVGVGPGNSTQRNFLPAPYSDFVFAIIYEEYGLLGGAFVILLFMLLLFRCVRLVTISPKAFGAILALGIGLSLVLQALTNIAVSVHLLPVTGLTLPMLSMGGTSLLLTCISFGIILSVSKYIEKVT